MFKKLFLVLFIIISLVLPAHTASQTLEQEKKLMGYIANTIDDYVRTVDWSFDRSYGYNKELDHIVSLITKFGYAKNEYNISLYGTKSKPVGLIILIKGKANPTVKPQWRFVWILNSIDQVVPNSNNKLRHGI